MDPVGTSESTIEILARDQTAASCLPAVEAIAAPARVVWVDWVKTLGIVIVVSGHARLPLVIQPWLHTFLIPLFFVVSGYLMSPGAFNGSFVAFYRRRLSRLMWAYFLFGSIGALQVVVMSQFGSEREALGDVIVARFGALIYGTASVSDDHPFCLEPVALWFLPAFVSSVVLTFLLMRLARRAVGWAFGGLAALTFLGEDLALPWELEASFAAAPLLALGHWLRVERQLVARALAAPVTWCVAMLAAGWVLAWLNPGPVDFRYSRFGLLPLYVLAGGVSLAGVFGLAARLPASAIVERISAATIFIFPTHQLVFWGIEALARNGVGLPEALIAGYPFELTKAAVTMALLVACYRPLRRVLPWL